MIRHIVSVLFFAVLLVAHGEVAFRPPAQALADLLVQHKFAAAPWLDACQKEIREKTGQLPESVRASLPRIAQTIQRERQANELRQLLDYRHERRIPTISSAAPAVTAAEQQVAALKEQACKSSPEAFAQLLMDTDDRLAAARNLLDRHWPDDAVLRAGIGPNTFGRYGWRDQFGGLVWDVVAWDRLASPATSSQIRVAPVGGTLAKSGAPVVSWVSAKHPATVRVGEGTVSWDVTESILAPGILIETGAPAIELARGAAELRAPDRILLPVRDTALSLRYRAGRELPPPEDNWLLLAWEKETNTPPVLVVFEKLPSRLVWTGPNLVIQFAGPAGKIAVGSYAGIGEWSPETSLAWQDVPRAVLKRCRDLAAVLSHFPVGLDELFAVDEAHGEVVINDRLQWVPFAFTGRVTKQPAIPLPPVLSIAVPAGFPATLPTYAQEWDLPTRSGPYRLSSGTSATFRLPISRYDHPVLPAALTASSGSLELPANPAPDDLCRRLETWLSLTPADRERLGQMAKTYLAEQLAVVTGGKACAIEPLSLTLYVDFVSSPDGQGSAASLRHSALLLDATYRYTKFSGDWDFVREHMAALRDLLDTQVAMTDWASMSPLPREGSPSDSLPDALRGALAMGQMAEAVGDWETLRLARYLTARLLVPYGGGFLVERATAANRWNEHRLPASWSGVPFGQAVARVAGLPVMPELADAATATCRQETRTWLQVTLPRQFPDWNNQGSAADDYRSLLRNLAIPLTGTENAPLPPIRLAEWQPAALGSFTYDVQTETARLELTGATRLRCTATRPPTDVLDQGVPLLHSAWLYSFEQGRLVVALEAGPHELEFRFASVAEPVAPQP